MSSNTMEQGSGGALEQTIYRQELEAARRQAIEYVALRAEQNNLTLAQALETYNVDEIAQAILQDSQGVSGQTDRRPVNNDPVEAALPWDVYTTTSVDPPYDHRHNAMAGAGSHQQAHSAPQVPTQQFDFPASQNRDHNVPPLDQAPPQETQQTAQQPPEAYQQPHTLDKDEELLREYLAHLRETGQREDRAFFEGEMLDIVDFVEADRRHRQARLHDSAREIADIDTLMQIHNGPDGPWILDQYAYEIVNGHRQRVAANYFHDFREEDWSELDSRLDAAERAAIEEVWEVIEKVEALGDEHFVELMNLLKKKEYLGPFVRRQMHVLEIAAEKENQLNEELPITEPEEPIDWTSTAVGDFDYLDTVEAPAASRRARRRAERKAAKENGERPRRSGRKRVAALALSTLLVGTGVLSMFLPEDDSPSTSESPSAPTATEAAGVAYAQPTASASESEAISLAEETAAPTATPTPANVVEPSSASSAETTTTQEQQVVAQPARSIEQIVTTEESASLADMVSIETKDISVQLTQYLPAIDLALEDYHAASKPEKAISDPSVRYLVDQAVKAYLLGIMSVDSHGDLNYRDPTRDLAGPFSLHKTFEMDAFEQLSAERHGINMVANARTAVNELGGGEKARYYRALEHAYMVVEAAVPSAKDRLFQEIQDNIPDPLSASNMEIAETIAQTTQFMMDDMQQNAITKGTEQYKKDREQLKKHVLGYMTEDDELEAQPANYDRILKEQPDSAEAATIKAGASENNIISAPE